MGNEAKGDIMRTQGKDPHTEPGSSQTKDDAAGLAVEPAFDQKPSLF